MECTVSKLSQNEQQIMDQVFKPLVGLDIKTAKAIINNVLAVICQDSTVSELKRDFVD
jgi:hypothetical protein